MGKIKRALLRNPLYWVFSFAAYIGWVGPFLISASFTPAVIAGFIIPFVFLWWIVQMANFYKKSF